MSNPHHLSDARTSEEILSFDLKAKNYAEDSENKIHGDDAARHGFRGGLVPGIGIYAYMTRALVQHFGPAWIERGWGDLRLIRPVYDGDHIQIRILRADREADSNAVRAEVLARPDMTVLATLEGGMKAGSTAPDPNDYPSHPIPPRDGRPTARINRWPASTPLGDLELTLDLDLAAHTFVADVLDPLPHYIGGQAVLHPALLLAQANFILRDNIALGAWIHTSSSIRHFGDIRAGETLSLRGRIAESYQKNGHEYVTADLAAFVGTRPAAQIKHTAIIRLRTDMT